MGSAQQVQAGPKGIIPCQERRYVHSEAGQLCGRVQMYVNSAGPLDLATSTPHQMKPLFPLTLDQGLRTQVASNPLSTLAS